MEDARVCRICLGDCREDEMVVCPCKCKGTQKYVHTACHLEWVRVSQRTHCSVCNHPFAYTWTDGYSDHPSVDLLHTFTYQLLSSCAFFTLCTTVQMSWTLYIWQTCTLALHPVACPTVAYTLPRVALLGAQDLHVATLMLRFEGLGSVAHTCVSWCIVETVVVGLVVATFNIHVALTVLVVYVYIWDLSSRYCQRVFAAQERAHQRRCDTAVRYMEVCDYEELVDLEMGS